MLWVWTQFLVCMALIGMAGVKLTRYGDVIADKTGLGGSWIGVMLIASVTSLPELATGISAVGWAIVPDIALGDILGSCVFNLLILVVIDTLHRGGSVYARASVGHVLSGAFGIVLIGLTAAAILLSVMGLDWRVFHIGLYTPLIVLLYAVSIRTVFRYETQQVQAFTESEPDRYPQLSLRSAWLRYLAAAALVVVAGVWLPFVGQDLAEAMGWRQSFVGTLFVAFVTSVPELVVTLSALQIGAVDLAVGNLLGSNLFNILILAVDDLVYTDGPLLADVQFTHAISAISALTMTGLAIAGLFYRPKARPLLGISWISLCLLIIYAMNTYAAYYSGGAHR